MRRTLARTATTTTTTTSSTTVAIAVALALTIGVLATTVTPVAATHLSAVDDANLPYSLGPWLSATPSVATIGVLDDALRLAQLQPGAIHPDAATPRICFDHVTAIEQQIVDGINFRFHVAGCALRHVDSEFVGLESPPPPRSGRCPYACGAQEEAFRVTVFCQPWSHTTQVLSIVREAAAML